jgi:superfamily II DNA or RNA helicase
MVRRYVNHVIEKRVLNMNLRKWQKNANDKLLEIIASGRDRALIAACPGAGKTHFTGNVLTNSAINCGAEFNIIVVPSRALKRQWKKALKRWNLTSRDDIDNTTLSEANKRGASMFDPADPVHIYTYAQIAADYELFNTLCSRYKVYVVFDEIHHADESKPYGDSMVKAFSEAAFKLSLTGTPFNTSSGTLAFCDTREEVDDDGKLMRVTITDFDYSYGDALAASGDRDDPYVVRPVTFLGSDGLAWRTYYDKKEKRQFTKTYDGTRKSDPLTPMLDVEEQYVREMIKSGLAKLDGIRRDGQRNAGMLITAMDGDHARAISDYMRRELGVNDQSVVLHDTPGAQKAIENFDKSSDRVLIAVKIVSEGVDITRLRVGVYASNVMTFLFFIQFVGRFIRWDNSLGCEQRAYVIIPNHLVIEGYAERIEEMIAHAYIPEEGEGGGGGGEDRNELLGKGSKWAQGAAIERGERVAKDERADLDALMEELNIKHLSYDEARRIRDKIGSAYKGSGGTYSNDDDSDPREIESKKNDKLVSKIVVIAAQRGYRNLDYSYVQHLANQAVGIDKKDKLTPTNILVDRKLFLMNLLKSVYGGDLDASDAA